MSFCSLAVAGRVSSLPTDEGVVPLDVDILRMVMREVDNIGGKA